MKEPMKTLKGIIAVLLVPISILVALTACDGDPTPTPSLPPGDGDVNRVINEGHLNMRGLKSFHFKVQGTKDGAANLTIEGDIEGPDKVRSSYEQPGQKKGELIVFGQDTYLKQSDSESFIKSEGGNVPPDIVGTLLNPQALTYYALLGDNQKIVGEEKVDGVDAVRVSFLFKPDEIQNKAAEIMAQPTPRPQTSEQGDYKGDMWVEKGANYVRRIEWLPPPPATGTPEARTVRITYSKFNEPISPPIQVPPAFVTKTPTPTPALAP